MFEATCAGLGFTAAKAGMGFAGFTAAGIGKGTFAAWIQSVVMILIVASYRKCFQFYRLGVRRFYSGSVFLFDCRWHGRSIISTYWRSIGIWSLWPLHDIFRVIKPTPKLHYKGPSYHSGRLQPVGQNNVWVHCSHVQVIDYGVLQPGWGVPQVRQLLLDLVTDLFKVGHLLHRNLLLDLNRALHAPFNVVVEFLKSFGHQAKSESKFMKNWTKYGFDEQTCRERLP